MLGGSEEAQKHTPTLTRQWLKDKILQELPSVKSVRQKDRRKPSVLYCPEACEEDMVDIAMVPCYESEMDNMKMLYKTKIVIVDGMVLVQQMTKNPSGVLELGWSSSLLILTSWFWLLRTMTKEHSHIDGLGCCGDLTNFECTWRREGSSITCISCIHWCRHCWKILRTWLGFNST